MSENVGAVLVEISLEFLEEALKVAYGMPDDAVIEDATVEHNIRFTPSKRSILLRISHPSLPPVVEGGQVLRANPAVKRVEWDWGL